MIFLICPASLSSRQIVFSYSWVHIASNVSSSGTHKHNHHILFISFITYKNQVNQGDRRLFVYVSSSAMMYSQGVFRLLENPRVVQHDAIINFHTISGVFPFLYIIYFVVWQKAELWPNNSSGSGKSLLQTSAKFLYFLPWPL